MSLDSLIKIRRTLGFVLMVVGLAGGFGAFGHAGLQLLCVFGFLAGFVSATWND